jgi:carbonic anhydrase/acetyltransferase-like protein (isoleucine patch superfamily)
MDSKKYKLVGKAVAYQGYTLRRIEALRDFGDVRKGDLGGWIESESNLSQEGDCWVGGEAQVYGGARVYSDALVYNDARVYENAQVYDNAHVCGDARVCGHAWVYGNAWVNCNAQVYEDACVRGEARVFGYAKVYGDSEVCDQADVYGDAQVRGDARVCGSAVIYGDAVVEKMGDYIVFQNIWSSGRWFTYTASNKMWKVGCFYGTGERLVKKAYADGEEKGRCYEKVVNLVNQLKEGEK